MLESQPGVELAFGLVAGESVAMYRRLLRLFEAGRAAAARAEARRLLERQDRRLLAALRTALRAPRVRRLRRAP